MKQAIIQAGGIGSRLGNLTQDMPKPMIPIGNYSVLEHQIQLLKQYHIHDIIIITHYLSHVIQNHFGNGEQFGVSISYYHEQTPLGTSGGIKELEHRLTSDFLVLYGDVMIDMDLMALIDFHKQKQSLCTLTLHPNDHPYDSDLVDIDDTFRITGFYSKPHNSNRYYRNLVNAAVYVMSPQFLSWIPKGAYADFGKNIFPDVYQKVPMYGYCTSEYIKDMGTFDRLTQIRQDYSKGIIQQKNRENPQKAIFLDRDGVINREVNFLTRLDDFELLPGVAEAIRLINQSEYLAIVITNQSVIARNMCTLSELQTIHNKMETLLGMEGAKLDAIYFCPHHPDKGYPNENSEYKIICNCRKPKIGLVEQAQQKFHIDLTQSFFIGDSTRDIQCGKNAGMTSIEVQTGWGVDSTICQPEYSFPDLKQAVHFILESN